MSSNPVTYLQLQPINLTSNHCKVVKSQVHSEQRILVNPSSYNPLLLFGVIVHQVLVIAGFPVHPNPVASSNGQLTSTQQESSQAQKS